MKRFSFVAILAAVSACSQPKQPTIADIFSPRVLSVEPADGTRNVSATNTVRYHYTEVVDIETFRASVVVSVGFAQPLN